MVGNLVDNALDAVTGPREASVRVLVEDTPDEVMVTVRDTGPGVAAPAPRKKFSGRASPPKSRAPGRHGALAWRFPG